MNKKKLSLATTALALSTVMLAGCGNNAENKAVTETTDISVTEEVTEATTTTAATTTEVTTTTTAATTTEVTTTTTEITTAATTTTEATTTEAITTTEAVTEAITEKVTEKPKKEKDYSNVKWGDDIPMKATNVNGDTIKTYFRTEWVERGGGKMIIVNSYYYKTFQDWIDGKKPLTATEINGRDYDDVKWGDEIPMNAINVYGHEIWPHPYTQWVEEGGGKMMLVNGSYYRTFQDWVDGKTPLSRDEIEGSTLAERIEEVGIIEWN